MQNINSIFFYITYTELCTLVIDYYFVCVGWICRSPPIFCERQSRCKSVFEHGAMVRSYLARSSPCKSSVNCYSVLLKAVNCLLDSHVSTRFSNRTGRAIYQSSVLFLPSVRRSKHFYFRKFEYHSSSFARVK